MSRASANLAGALLAAAILSACSADATAPTPSGNSSGPTPTAAASLVAADPNLAELGAELDALRHNLELGVELARQAAASTDLDQARTRGADIVHVLTASPTLRSQFPRAEDAAPLSVRPLLPGPLDDIADDADYDDILASVASAARDAGVTGAAVSSLLRDPIAGDVPSWQEDAAGMLALAETAATAGSLAQIDGAAQALDGAATRAIAYALALASAPDLATATEHGDRIEANLALALSAIMAVETP